MPHVAVHVTPRGVAVMPCTYVTVAGERFALCRPPLSTTPGLGDGTHLEPPPDRTGWEVVDVETGQYIAFGPTKAETILTAERRLAGLNPGSLQRERERVLVKQWGLSTS